MNARFAWRLVRPLQGLAYASVIPSSLPGRYHEAGECVVYGWSSSEMAFLSLLDLTGPHPPLQLVREKLQLPTRSGRIETLAVLQADGSLGRADAEPPSRLLGAMKRKGLLGVWVPAGLMPSEHILVLNPDAPAFADVALLHACTVSRGRLF